MILQRITATRFDHRAPFTCQITGKTAAQTFGEYVGIEVVNRLSRSGSARKVERGAGSERLDGVGRLGSGRCRSQLERRLRLGQFKGMHLGRRHGVHGHAISRLGSSLRGSLSRSTFSGGSNGSGIRAMGGPGVRGLARHEDFVQNRY